MNRHLWYRAQRYPRTLAEAFRGAEYGAAIERPAPRSGIGRWLAFSALALLCLSLIAGAR